jgi:hypothetical protein
MRSGLAQVAVCPLAFAIDLLGASRPANRPGRMGNENCLLTRASSCHAARVNVTVTTRAVLPGDAKWR